MTKDEACKRITQALVHMTKDEYFAKSEDRKVVTPENLGGLLEYPALFHAMSQDRELRPALSEAMTTGRAMADFLSLTPAEFAKAYEVVDGPVNPKTGKPYGTDTKAYAEWRATLAKTPVSTEQFNMFGKMADAYNGHGFVTSLAGCTVISNAFFQADVEGVPCLCMVDKIYVGDESVIAVDVKTTSDLNGFTRSADALRYREQQALANNVLFKACGIKAQMRIAAIEKGPLPRCGVFWVRDIEDMCVGVNEVLREYASSQTAGVYRTLFEGQYAI